MKKIVTLAAIAALSCGMIFAAEPAANVSITDFTGNAKVEWGVDLDAGKTGFKNEEYIKFVINLFDAGEKTTEANGDVWAELVMKAGNCKSWSHRLFQIDGSAADMGQATSPTTGGDVSFDIDVAKLHFYNFYVGIQQGDTLTGEYKFDGAIRSADNGNAQWLSNVGPAGFTQGIVAGYADDNFDFGVDFRSYYDASTQYTNAYAFAAEAKLKDSNSFAEGLFVDLGGSFATTDIFYKKADEGSVEKAYVNEKEEWVLGYSANAGYKFKLDDKYFVKPAVGFTGSNVTSTNEGDKNSKAVNKNSLVAGVIFGWGDTADANAGVYYLDGDMAKKVTPGVSVVAAIPLPETEKGTQNDKAYSVTTNKALKALIVPSFYSGDLVENLTAAVYSEMGLLQSVKAADQSKGTDDVTNNESSVSKETFAFAIAAGAKYDIKSDAATITPQIGFRFANGAYFDNNINATSPLSSNPVFKDMGEQIYIAKKDADNVWTVGYDNFLNLKAGVNVNGLINNTDLYVVYQSANLLNKTNYGEKTTIKVGGVSTEVDNPLYRKEGWYNVKLGTLTLGTKISF
jgi:hypothetical protein